MNANELRIGNIILAEFGMGYEQQEVVSLETFKRFESDHVLFSGIPLTEDWLIRLGFNGWDYGLYTLDLIQFNFMHLIDNDMVTIAKNIKYVHQLQNLYFALTGEELTIKE